MEGKSAKVFLPQLNWLRAIASVLVALFHLICGNPDYFPSDSLIEEVFTHGYLGLEMFFILSGFVVCWAIPENFTLKQAPIFYAKRLTRIEPVYICSIVFILILEFGSALARNVDYSVSPLNLLYHLAYLNNFGLGEYLNVVYWTLGIEFQFYILIGILFPFLVYKYKGRWQLILIILLATFLFFIPTGGLKIIWYIWPLFMLGILSFLFYTKRIGPWFFGSAISLQLILIALSQDWQVLSISVITLLIIFLVRSSNSIVDFFARISYSLYLIHVPIGGKVINLSTRFAKSPIEKYGVLILAFGASVLVSWLFYKFIEKPFLALSKKIKYQF